jgi:hypothetical protein
MSSIDIRAHAIAAHRGRHTRGPTGSAEIVNSGQTASMTAPEPAATTWAMVHMAWVTGSAASASPQHPAIPNTTRAWARIHRNPAAVTT